MMVGDWSGGDEERGECGYWVKDDWWGGYGGDVIKVVKGGDKRIIWK